MADRIQLNDKIAVTRAQLDAILAANDTWPFPAAQDPWVLIHNSIRKDMADLTTALTAVAAGIKGGAPLEAWQVAYLKDYIPHMHGFIHHHHDVEEQILFPWLQTRTELSERMSADHVQLMQILDRLKDGAACLQLTGKADVDAAAVEGLRSTLAQLSPLMEEHFQEEEDKGLPLFRMHFSPQDLKPIDKQIQKGLTLMDFAHFLNPLKTDAEKKKVMTQLGVPGIIRWLMMMPACKKYDRLYQSKLRELQAGKRAAPRWIFAW